MSVPLCSGTEVAKWRTGGFDIVSGLGDLTAYVLDRYWSLAYVPYKRDQSHVVLQSTIWDLDG
jgi:hypothetical protein